MRLNRSAQFRALALVGWCGACLLAAPSAWAEYKLRPGDVLSFTVVGMADLATRATVDGDGNISLPLASTLR